MLLVVITIWKILKQTALNRFPVLDVIVVGGGGGGIVVLKLNLALIPVGILKEEKVVENENLLKEREPERYLTATRGAVAAEQFTVILLYFTGVIN
ncbi:hypothetical protein CFP56_042277 [Quercus suber]|uniref:Uncharacterized protein n=1 Tax=Quercus suber TaxID=58331 RepID=A0AAW0LIQ8_QUESU